MKNLTIPIKKMKTRSNLTI